MATKAQHIFELLQNTVKSLSDYENWTAFLKSAAWQYKYPFEDKALIYAQRPDATACARIEVWNNSMHRWINRGAKGIALLRENGSRYGLEYVFDVSDTNDFYSRDVRLWQYDERYEDAVIETLRSNFGDLKVDVTVKDAIICAAHNAVQDNKADYLHELSFVKGDSFLHGLDDVNIDLRFRQTAEVSVAYMIMQRLGVHRQEGRTPQAAFRVAESADKQPDDMLDRHDFEYIRDFNTPEAMNILGEAVSVISETALRNISQTIRAEQRKFAQSRKAEYNKNENNINRSDIKERNDEHGRNSVQDSRRLSDTRSDSTDGGTQDRQIRNDEKNISQGASPEPLFNASDEGRAAQSLGGDRQDGDGAGTKSRGADGESRGRDGSDESERPIEMDRFSVHFRCAKSQPTAVRASSRYAMNNFRHSVEEIILSELVYS